MRYKVANRKTSKASKKYIDISKFKTFIRCYINFTKINKFEIKTK